MTNKDIGLQLEQFINNIEFQETEKKAINENIAGIYKEAKTAGFDVSIVKKIIALRKMPADQRAEMEQMLETYQEALGMKKNDLITDYETNIDKKNSIIENVKNILNADENNSLETGKIYKPYLYILKDEELTNQLVSRLNLTDSEKTIMDIVRSIHEKAKQDAYKDIREFIKK